MLELQLWQVRAALEPGTAPCSCREKFLSWNINSTERSFDGILEIFLLYGGFFFFEEGGLLSVGEYFNCVI